MQIKQVAELLGVDKKEVIEEVQAQRDDFIAQGHKIAKKLGATSALDEEVVKIVLANFDVRRQVRDESEKADAERRHREEEERRRAAVEIERKRKEQEMKIELDERRRKADEELRRKQAEQQARPSGVVATPGSPAVGSRPAAKTPAPGAKSGASAASPRVTEGTPGAQQKAPVARPTTGKVEPTERHKAAPPPPPSSAMLRKPTAEELAGGNAPKTQGTSPANAPAVTPRPPSNYHPNQDPRNRERQAPSDSQRPSGNYQQRQGQPGGQRPNTPGQRPSPQGGRPGGPGSRPSSPGSRPSPGGRPGGPGGRGDARPGDGRGGDQRYDRGAGDRQGRPSGGRPSGGGADVSNLLEGGMGPKLEQPKRARRKPGKDRPERVAETEEQAKQRRAKVLEDSKKRFRPTQIFQGDVLTDRRGANKGGRRPGGKKKGGSYRQVPQRPKEIRLIGDFTVGDFAEKTNIPINQIIGKLMMMGEMLTINHILLPEKAEELAIDLGIEIIIEEESDDNDIAKFFEDDIAEDTTPRAPVITIMGHVDHGKTSLLDKIRRSDVATGEAGGITQHIGAYKVKTEKGDIVFLDTPGHEAFTEMRSRGANVTDLVVLVVAANDGVMPQTIEAINHAKAAEVPILVAINKMDVEGANPTRVKQELMKYEMVSEDLGGDTIMVEVSAATGQGLDTLLEYMALQTEILELKSNPEARPIGTIVESHIDSFKGVQATVLIERGTLRIGDVFVCGTEWGRVRSMNDDRGRPLEEAGPATPVGITGLRGSPVAGEKFVVLPSEAEARDISERRDRRRRTRKQATKPHISLDNLAEHMTADGDVLQLNVVIKGDVQGSVEAIGQTLFKIKSDRVAIKIIHAGVGAVNTSDINLAEASNAIVIAFTVGVNPPARSLAEESGVDIRSYDIIYALVEDVEKAMLGLLEPEFEEKEEGRAKIQDVFRVSKVGTAAGCLVEEGTINVTHQARLVRNGNIVWKGKLASLRRVKDEVKTVQAGVECGIGLAGFQDVKVGDHIETYSMIERQVSLVNREVKADTEKANN